VLIFDEDGKQLRQIGDPQGSAAGQLGGDLVYCAVDPLTGHVLVSESANHRVEVFNGDDGKLVELGYAEMGDGTAGLGHGQLNSPCGLAIHPHTGEIWVGGWKSHRVHVFPARSPT
jgi:DNA-binding beta-propeller fold protein YncE